MKNCHLSMADFNRQHCVLRHFASYKKIRLSYPEFYFLLHCCNCLNIFPDHLVWEVQITLFFISYFKGTRITRVSYHCCFCCCGTQSFNFLILNMNTNFLLLCSLCRYDCDPTSAESCMWPLHGGILLALPGTVASCPLRLPNFTLQHAPINIFLALQGWLSFHTPRKLHPIWVRSSTTVALASK